MHTDARINPVVNLLVVDIHNTAGIDQRKALILPVNFTHQPISGNPRLCMNNRDSLLGDPVKNSGLADIRSSDDRDDAPFALFVASLLLFHFPTSCQ